MLALSGVSKTYGRTTAVKSLDLVIEPGRTTVLIGPSGSGKSTLLRLMIGLVRPDSGEVRMGGRPVVPETVTGLRRRMGYVIQEGGLFPHLTARANVTIMARGAEHDRAAVEERLGELSRLTRFPAGALERYPLELSGGQRQRVSLMRALMLDPDLLLLDEPLGALDPLIRADLQVEMAGIFRGLGKTVVMVTHDMAEAVFFGDRIVLLNEGAIVQSGAPEDLLERPADPFVRRFLRAQRLMGKGRGE